MQNDYYIAFYVDYLMRKSRYFPIIATPQSPLKMTAFLKTLL